MENTTCDSMLERLLTACAVKNDSELSRILGLSSQAVSKARKAGSVPAAWIPKVSERFNVSTDWLFFGQGPMLRGDGKDVQPAAANDEDADFDLIKIPMVNAVLSAGTGSLETDGESERSYAFRRDFIARKGCAKNMVLMRVSGDSMQPEIMDGDVVLLDQSKRTAIPGRIFAVGFEDAIYLKRIDLLPGQAILKSVNPDYPPVTLDLRGQNGDQLRLIGQVLWVGREYR